MYKFNFILILSIIIVFINFANLFSQKEMYNWYYGQGFGCTFNTETGVPVRKYFKDFGDASCTSISDKNGELLFYANNTIIYNSKHDTIARIGLDEESRGLNYFTKGSMIILPNINVENQYYLLHTENLTYKAIPSKLKYSLIDMSLNNGLGGILTNGNVLQVGIDIWKLTATYHRNGRDIWIVTHEYETDVFYLFLLTEDGIKLHHTQNIGTILKKFSPLNDKLYNDGNIKFSPDSKKLAMNIDFYKFMYWPGYGEYFNDNHECFEIFDFNDSTGILSNPLKVETNLINSSEWQNDFKGIEFSPNSKKIYVKNRQYDITFNNISDIKNSEYRFNKTYDNAPPGEGNPGDGHGLYQLGPDGMIYFYGRNNILHVIENPNEDSIKFNFIYEGGPNSSITSTLPQFLTSWFKFEIKAESNSEVCEGNDLELYATDRLNAVYTWTGPNGFSSSEQDPVISNVKIGMSGWYYVTAERRYDEISSDSVFVVVNPKPVFQIEPKDTIFICQFGKTNLSSNNIQNDFTYSWSTGETSSSITVDSTGKYYLTVTNEYGCQSTDSVVVEYKYIQPEIEIIGNIPACEGDTIVLRTKEKYDVYNWSTGDTTSEIIVTRSSRCSISVIDSLGCTGTSEEIEILFYPKPKVNLRGPDTVCLGSNVTYHVNKNNNVGYGWWVELGSLVPGFYSDSVKVIWLQAGKGKIVTQQTNSFGCIGIDSMYVEIIDEVKPEIIPEKPVICGNGTLTLRTSEQYDSYEWSTGETSDSIVVSSTGIYFVKVTADGGCTGYDSVNVVKVDEPVAVIIGTTTLCKGESSVLSVSGDFAEYLWSTGETTKEIAVNQTGKYSVEVTDSNGCKASAYVDVKQIIISLDGLGDTDFGRISIDNKDNKNLIITNKSNESIKIEVVRLKSGNSELSISVNPQTPAVLDSGDIMVINIGFEPDGMQEYKDSLIIEVSEPCEEIFGLNITGIGTGKMLVWLPDVTKEVGYNICIPLYAKLMNTKPITLDTKFDAEIRYDVTALKPNKEYLIAGAERVINYTDVDLSVDKDTSVIAELCGTVLLARENTTPIYISDFTLTNPYCEVETLDGSLTILGCAIDISRVLLANNIEVSMYPNPTDDEITIQIKTDTNLDGNLIIYNSYGSEVASQIQQLKSGSNLIQLNTTNLSSGIYFVKVILNGYEYVVIPIGKIQ